MIECAPLRGREFVAKRPIILVVEDDEAMNALERELLAVHGFDSVPAYTGAEALRLCESCGADGVLLDLMLPEMDGFAACRELRRRDGKQLPVVIVSALDSQTSREQGYEAGANAYFTKPFDPDEVIDTLRRFIEKTTDNG